MLLTRSFVALARDMRKPRNVAVVYPDRELVPDGPSARELLERVVAAPLLADHVEQVGWMNPLYGALRRTALAQMTRRGDAHPGG